MLATATHDTKRGEDSRARLNALTEIPDSWRRLVYQLSRITATLRDKAKEGDLPTRNDEYILYQSLLGCWPLDAQGEPVPADAAFLDRVREFQLKAAREAKLHSSWIYPNAAYENGLRHFTESLLLGRLRAKFQEIFFPFLKTCARLGAWNGLAQVACKCAAPGVPDIYQGTERWDLSLVDPDNRRNVDFEIRRSALEAMEPFIDPAARPDGREEWTRNLLRRWPDGAIKQYLLARCLRWRRAHAELFREGSYRPLEIRGGDPDFGLAFAREGNGQTLLHVTALRATKVDWPGPGENAVLDPESQPVFLQLPGEWAGKKLRHLFTDQEYALPTESDECRLDVDSLLKGFPVAWLWLE
jgi:(1->4)-alpha-D-glucan 1-alpha-D-glucosylmutase